MKIALGTVQFGLEYGISNESGKVSTDEVTKILSLAEEKGIDTLDTACLYGDAEIVLGQQKKRDRFRIISKTDKVSGDVVEKVDVEKFDRSFHDSLKRLKVDKIAGLMLHQAEDLLKNNGRDLYDWLRNLKGQGKVEKIGASVYHPETLSEIVKQFDIDIVQIPANFMDHRFFDHGLIEKIKSKNIEIHLRSLYLQGLLLMDKEKIDPFFFPIMAAFSMIEKTCQKYQLNKLQLCIAYGLQLGVDRLVVGATSVKELEETIMAYEHVRDMNLTNIDFSVFKQGEHKYILPYEWELNNE